MQILASQLNLHVGNFNFNTTKILECINDNKDNTDLIIFSELSLPGYYPKDLIIRQDFVNTQNKYLNKIIDASNNFKPAIILGVIIKNSNPNKLPHNSAVVIHNGRIIYTYHKQLLPVYNIFNEARHFSSGNEPGIFEFKNKKLAITICEDSWAKLNNYQYYKDPIEDLIDKNLDLIISINASPSNIGKIHEREITFRNIHKKTNSPVLFVNQVGGDDDIVFDGTSFILNNNEFKYLKSFENDNGIIQLGNNIEIVSGFNQELTIDPNNKIQLCYQQCILGLKDYITKCGFNGVVLGISGGIDSALTAALACAALGPNKVIGISMPSIYSSDENINDSIELCKNLGMKLYTYPIKAEHELAETLFETVFNEAANSLTQQNIQARLRGRLLMSYSNQYGHLVLSTGNKSELSVGYTTLYGDMAGGFNVIGDLYKMEVYELSKYYNAITTNKVIPKNIITKAPTAELKEDQKDSDSLPEYEILDPILKLYIEGDVLPDSEKFELEDKISNYDSAILKKVYNLVNKAEYKRRQSAPIIRLQRISFGKGYQYPISATYPD